MIFLFRGVLVKTGSLSTRVFEARMATRSELFTLLTFLHTITITLLCIISPLETISRKMWAPENPRHTKCSLPVAVRVSKTRVRKLTRDLEHTRFLRSGRQATRSKHFACQDSSVSQSFKLINCNSEKILKNRNVVVSKEA